MTVPETATLVRILTAVLTPASAALCGWAAKHGLQLPVAEVVTVSVSSSTAVLLMGWHWLQKHITPVQPSPPTIPRGGTP